MLCWLIDFGVIWYKLTVIVVFLNYHAYASVPFFSNHLRHVNKTIALLLTFFVLVCAVRLVIRQQLTLVFDHNFLDCYHRQQECFVNTSLVVRIYPHLLKHFVVLVPY